MSTRELRSRRNALRKGLSFNNQTFVGWLMMGPTLIILGTFVYWLIIQAFSLSFYKSNIISGAKTFIGLGNYEFLFTRDRVFKLTLSNTFTFTIFNMLFAILLSLGLALICQRTGWLMSLFRTATFLPVVIPMVTAGLIWKLMLEPQFGIINTILAQFNVPPVQWLYSSKYALPTVIFVSVWKELGMYTIIFVGGLQQISLSLYEAASIDGASVTQSFRYITLPQLKPTIFFVCSILLIASFKIFDQVWIMTEGGPGVATLTLTAYIYQRIYDSPGLANAGSVVLFLIVFILTVLQWAVFERRGEKA